MGSCGMNLIKYLLFIFNLLFAISGVSLIAAGAVILNDVGSYDHFTGNELFAAPVILIVTGVIIFVVAFLGCFGAIKESFTLLIVFAVCLVIIFILEIAAAAAAAVYKHDLEDSLRSTLKGSLANYSSSEIERSVWDKIQEKLKCCGVDGPENWQGQNVPRTCCHLDADLEKNAYSNYCQGSAYGKYLYQSGCYEKMKERLLSSSTVVVGVGIGIAFVKVIGIILSCWLAFTIKKGGTSK